MDTGRVREHFEAIRRPSGFLDPFDMTNVLKTLVGRPLEAVIPGADRTAVLLAQTEHVDEASAVETKGGTRAWSPSCTSIYRRCLIVDAHEGRYAVMMHLANEPKPWSDGIDDMFDKMRAQKGLPPLKRDTSPGRAEEISVYRVWPDSEWDRYKRPSLADALAGDADDEKGYMPTKCFSKSRSIGGYEDGRAWTDSTDDLRADGMDAWPTFFRRLAAVAEEAGALDVLQEGVREVEGRCWSRPDREGLETLAACEAFVDELHAEHGMLLGRETAAAIQVLQGMSMEAAAEELLARVNELRPMLEEGGHLSRKAAYDCNDGRNVTWLDGGDDIWGMVFENQNRKMRVSQQEEILLVEDMEGAVAPVVFHFEDGKARMVGLPSLGVETARAWNSVTLDAETVLCCLGEDKQSPSSPRF